MVHCGANLCLNSAFRAGGLVVKLVQGQKLLLYSGKNKQTKIPRNCERQPVPFRSSVKASDSSDISALSIILIGAASCICLSH